jgi:hypothetical protein
VQWSDIALTVHAVFIPGAPIGLVGIGADHRVLCGFAAWRNIP